MYKHTITLKADFSKVAEWQAEMFHKKTRKCLHSIAMDIFTKRQAPKSKKIKPSVILMIGMASCFSQKACH